MIEPIFSGIVDDSHVNYPKALKPAGRTEEGGSLSFCRALRGQKHTGLKLTVLDLKPVSEDSKFVLSLLKAKK